MSSPATLRSRVAAEIRAEMARQRKPGLELAALLDISQSAASRLMNGERDIDINELGDIAQWLGLTPFDLLRIPVSPTPPTAKVGDDEAVAS